MGYSFSGIEGGGSTTVINNITNITQQVVPDSNFTFEDHAGIVIVPSASFLPDSNGIYTFPNQVRQQLFEYEQSNPLSDAVEFTIEGHAVGPANLLRSNGQGVHSNAGFFAAGLSPFFGYHRTVLLFTVDEGYIATNGNRTWAVSLSSATNTGTRINVLDNVDNPNGGTLSGMSVSIRERIPNVEDNETETGNQTQTQTTEFQQVAGPSGDIITVPTNPRFEFVGIPLSQVKSVNLVFTSRNEGQDAKWVVGIDRSLIDLVERNFSSNHQFPQNMSQTIRIIFKTEGSYHLLKGVNYHDTNPSFRFGNYFHIHFYYMTNENLLEGLSIYAKSFGGALAAFTLESMQVERIVVI